MAYSLQQTVPASNASIGTLVVNYTAVTPGQLLTLGVEWSAGTLVVPTGWTQIGSTLTPSGFNFAMLYRVPNSAETTVSLTTTASATPRQWAVEFDEFHGFVNVPTLDKNTSNTSGSAANVSAPAPGSSLASATELIVTATGTGGLNGANSSNHTTAQYDAGTITMSVPQVTTSVQAWQAWVGSPSSGTTPGNSKSSWHTAQTNAIILATFQDLLSGIVINPHAGGSLAGGSQRNRINLGILSRPGGALVSGGRVATALTANVFVNPAPAGELAGGGRATVNLSGSVFVQPRPAGLLAGGGRATFSLGGSFFNTPRPGGLIAGGGRASIAVSTTTVKLELAASAPSILYKTSEPMT